MSEPIAVTIISYRFVQSLNITLSTTVQTGKNSLMPG